MRMLPLEHDFTISRGTRSAAENVVVRISDDEVRRTIELAALPSGPDGYVFCAEESYDPPTSTLDRDGQGAPYAVYGYGAQVVELSVDTRLGTVRLHRITAAHDVGHPHRPLALVEGPFEQALTPEHASNIPSEIVLLRIILRDTGTSSCR